MIVCDICTTKKGGTTIKTPEGDADLCNTHAGELQRALKLACGIFRTGDKATLSDVTCREWVERMIASKVQADE